ncbi:MAG TPA: di-heme oxidoredictase family protein [Thermoanaerobaculia bacterium]
MKGHSLSVVSIVLLLFAAGALAQTDPGPRGGAPGAGGALASVLANNPTTILNFFNDGKTRFQEIDSVVDGFFAGEGGGLGPRYNSRSCARCHAQPAVGGSSPSLNPQFEDAIAHGASNTLPSFITIGGPVREARFVYFTDAAGNPITSQPNGAVEPLFIIAGRPDAGSCTTSVISQPNFASAQSHNNVIFRIPTPVFGSGLIENIEETTLLQAVGGNPFGIAGTLNRNPNDGTITRFGWKAQNKSLEIFAGEAYNVEQGVSNELFTQERPTPEEEKATGLPSQCKINATPEDHTNFNTTAVGTISDTVSFAMFMRLLAPPQPATYTGLQQISVLHGQTVFTDIGCAACHRQSFTTSPSAITPDLGNKTANLYSDLELHHMGTTLADNIQQGNAGGDQFRTAPLWGLGQRLFFLHDGHRTNLLDAIADHQSAGSEASSVILNFNALSTSDKQDVLNFLRSL